ncbi:Glycoside hydrolase, family 35 [Moelleriella libera RCEF 2490]|uniref:Glycoside hydrolase, family 35 n=1 Tax=Moelleriella libera RCEF 2490 TaxID=1081109 RepID=A0A166NWZ9_9HYPO|nr:Glycoside hydrolase, family 35 [Moelleriella libera RCEF 2490]
MREISAPILIWAAMLSADCFLHTSAAPSNFTGANGPLEDPARILDAAASPYICGEREWGGFPAWLSEIPDMAVRQSNKPFHDIIMVLLCLRLMPRRLEGLPSTRECKARRLQFIWYLPPAALPGAARGGLSSLRSNHRRIEAISRRAWEASCGFARLPRRPCPHDRARERVRQLWQTTATCRLWPTCWQPIFDAFLYTNDGGGRDYLEGGAVHGILAATNGGSRSGLAARDELVTDPTSLGPQLDAKYYITWIDDWSSSSTHQYISGDAAHTKLVLDILDWILAGNNSFDICMSHRGTNWGFENGGIFIDGRLHSRRDDELRLRRAGLDESGRPTQMCHQLRDVISKHVPAGTLPSVPELPKLATVETFNLHPVAALFDTRTKEPAMRAAAPVTMESLG